MKLAVLISSILISASLTGCATTKGLEVSAEDAKECSEVGRMMLYTHAGGKQLPGLVSRRAAERALCERS